MTDMDRLFQKGDRVIGLGYCCGVDISGMVGTVEFAPLTELDSIGICFDNPREYFHNLGGYCADEHGFWVTHDNIALIFEDDTWSLDDAHNDLSELL